MDQNDRAAFEKLEREKARLLSEMKTLLEMAGVFVGPGMPSVSPAEALWEFRRAIDSAWKAVNEVGGP